MCTDRHAADLTAGEVQVWAIGSTTCCSVYCVRQLVTSSAAAAAAAAAAVIMSLATTV